MEPSEALAADTWSRHAAVDRRPLPARPTLAIFVGVPLSGKSTLAKALAEQATTRTLHVENDALRPAVASILGSAAPVYDNPENFLTYQTAWNLVGLGLDAGVNVIHDATNFTEAGRRGAYQRAEERFAPVVVVFVLAAREVLEARAADQPPERQEAYAKLGRKQPNPEACSRPTLVLDGAFPVGENLRVLRKDLHLVPFFTA